MDVSSLVRKLLEADDVDALRDGVWVLAQLLKETEVSSKIGAARYERSSSRTAYRNRYRTRIWTTRVGTNRTSDPQGLRGHLLGMTVWTLTSTFRDSVCS